MARLHRLVGMGSDQMIQELFDRDWPELSAAHSTKIAPFYDEMVAFDGAGQLLRRVRDSGLRPVLASSAGSDELARLEEIIGAGDAVAGRTSKADVGASKPAPDIFSVALERAAAAPQMAIAVGDTGWDIAAARRSGIGCIGLESGGWSGDELRRAGAVAVFPDVGELLSRLAESPIGELAAK